MRESVIERKACEAARSLGWDNRKMDSRRGDPDRLFFRKGVYVWCEFKKPGKTPTPLQRRRMLDLKERGERVLWADNVEDVIAYLKDAM